MELKRFILLEDNANVQCVLVILVIENNGYGEVYYVGN